MSMAIDETIARDLAALAADGRRGWRAMDSMLTEADASEPAPLATIAQVYARRAAWLASGATASVMTACTVALVLAHPVDAYNFALADRLAWVVVPALAMHALVRRLAAHRITAALAASPAPLVEGQRRLQRLPRAWLPLALATLVLPALVAGFVRVDTIAAFTPARTIDLAPVVLGTLALLGLGIAQVLHARARDEQRLAARPSAEPALVPLQDAIVQRAAWIGSGLGALAGAGAIVLVLAPSAVGHGADRVLAQAVGVDLWGLATSALSRTPWLLAFVLAGHIAGGWLGEHLVHRLAAQRGDLAPVLAALTRWAVAAVAAGAAILVTVSAMLRVVYADGIMMYGRAHHLQRLTLLHVMVAIALVVGLAVTLAWLQRRDARVLCVLRHNVTPSYALVMLGLVVRAAWRVGFTSGGGHHVLRPIMTFGLALASFLIVAWAGLRLVRRSRSTPPHAPSLE